MQVSDAYEKVFLKQVFYGCVRYEEFLKIFQRAYYKHYPSLKLNDAPMYSIFAYIVFFRLEEISPQDFKKLVQSQDYFKMHTFFGYIFDADILRKEVREQWMTCYDAEYLDRRVIGGITKNLPAVRDLLKYIEKKATGHTSTAFGGQASQPVEDGSAEATHVSADGPNVESLTPTQSAKKTTVPRPFNLTTPKPKQIPLPIKIIKEVKANPVPSTLHKLSLEQVETDKKARRDERLSTIRQ